MTDTNSNASQFYRRRLRELSTEIENGKRRHSRLILIILLLLAAACFLAYQGFISKTLPFWPALTVLPILALVGNRAKYWQKWLTRRHDVRDYYERGVARLERNWEKLDEGKEFAVSDHDYAKDLDLFGRGSMFQLLCSARTGAGRETLARWMSQPASAEEVVARREAIRELISRCDLREAIAGIHMTAVSNVRPSTFRDWVTEPARHFRTWMRLPAAVLAASLVVLTVLCLARVLPVELFWKIAPAVFAAELIYGGIFRPHVLDMEQTMGQPLAELPVVRKLTKILLGETFTSKKLIALQREVGSGKNSPRAQLRRIHHLMRLVRQRDETWMILFSYPVLWGTQFAIAIELWRDRWGADLLKWLDLLGQFEAMISISAYAFEHPLDKFPDLLDAGPEMDLEGMGHPLLDEQTCVRNDVRLGGNSQFLIVSGSNMSGKSTFLRGIGLNAVLAWMGAPVRCTNARISRVAVLGAISVQDSVTDGRSGFMAEMQRLKRMIDVAAQGPTLFLSDEMMSGTNSHDRRIAAEWIIRELVSHNAIGAVSTHDLALAEIGRAELRGKNVCFEDVGADGKLCFDFKLREGLPTRSNALNIARMLGISGPPA
jgi:hypothetical protein